LLGELQPVDGLVWLNPNASIAYFTQHHIDQLNLGLTPVQWIRELFAGTTEVEARRHLGKFGLMGTHFRTQHDARNGFNESM